jgi:uncharacterized OB-fold protein
MTQEKKKEELIRVENKLAIDYRFAAGPYLTKAWSDLRDKDILWGNRCPKCGHLHFPPVVVCAPCHVRLPEYPDGWERLSGKGYLDSWYKIVLPQMDLLGRTEPDQYLHCVAWLDEGVALYHFLNVSPDSPEEERLKRGLRVQMELKPREQRRGEREDIKYFNILWDEPPRKETSEDVRGQPGGEETERLEPLIMNDRLDLPVWSCAGRIGTKFLIELRDNQRIMGLRCPKCKKVYVPPKMVCSKCSVPMDEWVEVRKEGTLETFTVVNEHYSDFFQPKQPPYAVGIIKLDGADTGLCHFVDEVNPSNLKVGLRVQAVFRDKREASILDIDHFKVIA